MINPEQSRSSVLVIDDEEPIRNLLIELLPNHECEGAASAEDALQILERRAFDVVLSDINMPGISGLDLVPLILEKSPDTIVVMVSGEGTIESAIDAMHAGAFDYVTKPLDLRHVHAAIQRAVKQHDLLVRKRSYEEHLEDLIKERTAEVEHLAYYDSLTDLPNRNLFSDRCTQALASAQRSQDQVGIMLVSLDRLKKVTETLGPAAGDVVVTEASGRLQGCLRDGDTVARIDGDEFAILLPGIDGTGELADIARTISDAFKPSFKLSGHEVYVSTSIGISVYPANGEDSATTLRNAWAALYRAKKLGGNHYQFYAEEMNAQAVTRLALEASMRRGIDEREFIAYYQPLVNLPTGEVIGAEALVRWQHPDLGLMPSGEFIQLAEDTGLILDIGELVMRQAFAQTRAWQDKGFGRLQIAINVSARQLRQKSFLDRVIEALHEHRLDATCVELELTETTIMENTEAAVSLLNRIRNLGMKVAIDDFGTGYSSLSYLKRLPIDTVKLDQSFVKGATNDPDDAALVMAIVTLAHNLKLKVIAEGIETPEQLAFLRLLRCDKGQGYLFGKPVAAHTFESILKTDAKRNVRVFSDPKAGTRDKRRAVNE